MYVCVRERVTVWVCDTFDSWFIKQTTCPKINMFVKHKNQQNTCPNFCET